MRTLIVALFMGIMFTLGGCAMTMTPATGFIYTNAKGPFEAIGPAAASKEGRAECTSILGWVATGDCSIDTAAKNGGITKISTVDYDAYNILGFYAKLTVIVRGE